MTTGAPRDDRGGAPALEARLSADETRLARDEARLEIEEAEVRETRIVAWSGVGLALALVVAVTALIVSVIALSGDVGTIRRDTPADSVSTASLRDGAVTREKLADAAVDRVILAGGAVGADQLAPDAVTSPNVAANALTGADIKESSLHTVPAAQSAQSAQTAQESAHLGGLPSRAFLSSVVDVRIATAIDARAIKGPLVARCPAGSRVLSGGARIRGAVTGAALVTNAPDAGTGWTATARLASKPLRTWQLIVSAVCAEGGE